MFTYFDIFIVYFFLFRQIRDVWTETEFFLYFYFYEYDIKRAKT